jgi:hypothetical protein
MSAGVLSTLVLNEAFTGNWNLNLVWRKFSANCKWPLSFPG